MFIGHLPAGYITTKIIEKNIKTSKYLFIGLIASVLPDVDILYFYLIDGRKNLHHSYWIHIPFYWLIIGFIAFTFVWFSKKKEYYFALAVFLINIFLHLALDTIVGKIEWFYPFTDKAYYLFDVTAKYDFWIYNFVFHWTFLLEIGLTILATYIIWKYQKNLL